MIAKIFVRRRAISLVVGTEDHVVARGGSDVKGRTKRMLTSPNPRREFTPVDVGCQLHRCIRDVVAIDVCARHLKLQSVSAKGNGRR